MDFQVCISLNRLDLELLNSVQLLAVWRLVGVWQPVKGKHSAGWLLAQSCKLSVWRYTLYIQSAVFHSGVRVRDENFKRDFLEMAFLRARYEGVAFEKPWKSNGVGFEKTCLTYGAASPCDNLDNQPGGRRRGGGSSGRRSSRRPRGAAWWGGVWAGFCRVVSTTKLGKSTRKTGAEPKMLWHASKNSCEPPIFFAGCQHNKDTNSHQKTRVGRVAWPDESDLS